MRPATGEARPAPSRQQGRPAATRFAPDLEAGPGSVNSPAPESIGPAPADSPWCRTFPGLPRQVREARQFLTELLSGYSSANEAIWCLSELAANAVAHSRSAWPDGTFRVRLCRAGAGIRVEVTDAGGPWGAPPDGIEHGRGLNAVRQLASCTGITLEGPDRDNPTRRTVWFEMTAAVTPAAAHAPHNARTVPAQ